VSNTLMGFYTGIIPGAAHIKDSKNSHMVTSMSELAILRYIIMTRCFLMVQLTGVQTIKTSTEMRRVAGRCLDTLKPSQTHETCGKGGMSGTTMVRCILRKWPSLSHRKPDGPESSRGVVRTVLAMNWPPTDRNQPPFESSNLNFWHWARPLTNT